MTARDAILAKLRQRSVANGRTEFRYARDSFAEVSAAAPLDHFVALALAESMTVDHLANLKDVPAAIGRYLRAQHLQEHIVVDASACLAPDAFFDSGLKVSMPPLRPDHEVLVSGCLGAVAESGALVISTNDGHAIANDFLTETHIVILNSASLYATLADLWDGLRAEAETETKGGFMPREFCLVTGPSRTADLGVPAKLGAHGPARVHVLLVND